MQFRLLLRLKLNSAADAANDKARLRAVHDADLRFLALKQTSAAPGPWASVSHAVPLLTGPATSHIYIVSLKNCDHGLKTELFQK